jgi:hypothetical protein
VSEKFGPSFYPPVFDRVRPTTVLLEEKLTPNQIREFVGMSLYVAEKIESDLFTGYEGLDALAVRRIRPKTTALAADQLAKMKFYKEKRDEMRFN